MSSWNELLTKVQSGNETINSLIQGSIYQLAEYRQRSVICYYSGWLQHNTGESVSILSICDDDINGLMNAIYGLDRTKGLDLVLHTPGGDLAAAESIVKYLRDCFGNDICAIVPQMAMSAGTMIVCSCKEVIMGRQSSLGPTDPQINGVAACGVIEEFEQAVKEVDETPSSAVLWSQIIGKYHPTFLGECQKVVDLSKDMVGEWLKSNMLRNDGDAEQRAKQILDLLCEHRTSVMHNRHFDHKCLKDAGMHVVMMEDDKKLQDLILTLHHAFMISFQMSNTLKIIESNIGTPWLVSGAS